MITGQGPTGSHTRSSKTEDEMIDAAFEEVLGAEPRQIGPYRIIRQIGVGGMGVVYEAEQAEPARRVALKVTRTPPAAGRPYTSLFRREIDILARLHHPAIAQVFDAGRTRDGQQYFVMELIEGKPLDKYCETARFSLRGKLALFVRVCEAVQYAHQRGVIHRDLKPANILIDAEGMPHVLDFGLARLTDHEAGATQSVLSGHGPAGTLSYMSPEQTQTDNRDLDTRTDVYSLGVVLYQLLTGKFPYETTGNMRDVLDNILQAEPTRPSTISRLIDDEMETITLKCLSKERERRYPTVEDLARDIRHYLTGEVIEAKRDSAVYVLRKHLHRYRIPLALTAGIVLLVGALAVVGWLQYGRAERARAAETLAKVQSQQNESLARRHLNVAHLNLGMLAWQEGDVGRALARLQDQQPLPGEEDLRSFVWYSLWKLCHGGPLRTWTAHHSGVYCLAFSPDGGTLATTSLWWSTGEVKLWDTVTGAKKLTLRPRAPAVCLSFTPDGKTLAAGYGDWGPQTWGEVILWDVPAGRERAILRGHTLPVASVAFSHDGRQLASGTGNWWTEERNEAIVWDVAAQKRLHTLTSHEQAVLSVAFSPVGRTLATGSMDDTVKLWDAVTGEELGTLGGHTEDVRGVQFSPDGTMLATASMDNTVKLWNVAARQVERTLTDHAFHVNSVSFSPDGRMLATGSSDQTVKLWTLPDGELLRTYVGHRGWVMTTAFSPDGSTLASGACPAKCEVRLWDPRREPAQWATPFCARPGAVKLLAFSLDAKTLVIAWARREPGARGEAEIWDVPKRRKLAAVAGYDLQYPVVFSPDDKTLAFARADNTLELWDITTQNARSLSTGHAAPIVSLAFSPDGKHLATGSAAGTVKVWTVSTRQEKFALVSHKTSVRIRFVPDGRTLATWADGDRNVRLWDAADGAARAILAGHTEGVVFAACSPDGATLATGSADETVRLWDVATGRQRSTLDWLQPDPNRGLVFSPDGKMLAGWKNHPGLIRVWNVPTGEERFTTPEAQTHFVDILAFSPDGKTLAVADWTGTVTFLDPLTGEQQASLRAHGQPIDHMQFSPQGDLLVTGSRDGVVKIWQAATAEDVQNRSP